LPPDRDPIRREAGLAEARYGLGGLVDGLEHSEHRGTARKRCVMTGGGRAFTRARSTFHSLTSPAIDSDLTSASARRPRTSSIVRLAAPTQRSLRRGNSKR